jgi:hypothetical protein
MSAGTISDADEVSVNFVRSGDDGSGVGTVTSVATGTGLTGGTITSSGTVSVATGGIDTTQMADNAIDETKLKDALVADFTEVTVAAGDSILLGDATDSGNTKRDTVQGILDLAGSMDNVVDDTTPQLGGDLDCNGAQVQWSKGADVASAPALPVLTDGNYFDVTGTTGITSINTTGGPGTLIKLHFDGVVTLTHHASDLVLAGAANFTTAAGDELEFIEYASGDYRMTGWSLAGTAPGGGGGGAFLGEGAAGASVGDSGDIIRVNQNQLDTNQTFASGDNGSATGPLSIASGITLTITSGCTFAVI